MGADAAAAVRAACAPPGQIATLIVPADYSWSDGGEPADVPQFGPRREVQPECIRAVASILKSGEPIGLLLGGVTHLAAGLHAAGQLAAGTGVRVFADRNGPAWNAARELFAPQRVPYFPEPAEAALAGLKHLILVESLTPVSFFGYPGRRSTLAPEDCAMHVLACHRRGRYAGASGAGPGVRRWFRFDCGARNGAARCYPGAPI